MYPIVRKLAIGTLTTSRHMDIDPEDDDVFYFQFDCFNSQKFSLGVTRAGLIRQCPMLNESQELDATLNTNPELLPINTSFDDIVFRYTARGRENVYRFDLGLVRYQDVATMNPKIIESKNKIAELEAELARVRASNAALLKLHRESENDDSCATCIRKKHNATNWLQYALDTSNNEMYENLVISWGRGPNCGIVPWVRKLFKYDELAAPNYYDWKFDDALLARLKFMISHGLDMTIMMDDPDDKSTDVMPRQISCIDFAKRTVDAHLNMYKTQPQTTTTIVIMLGMQHAYYMLAKSVSP